MPIKPEKIRFQIHFEDAVHVSLGRSLYTTVDLEDFQRVPLIREQSWTVNQVGSTFYASATVSHKTFRLHQAVMGACPNPKRPKIDHIDGDGLHNRQYNLRWVSASQNARNSPSQHRSERSLFVCLAEHFRFHKITAIDDQLRALAEREAPRLCKKPGKGVQCVSLPVYLSNTGEIQLTPL